MRFSIKTILAVAICINCSLQLTAQNSSMEAKAAYLLAEEAFEAGKYENSIKFLDDAVVKLGTANAKILYLKILNLKMIAAREPSLKGQLKEAVEAFTKAPDASSFNEEKQMEIMKLKLKLEKEIAELPTNKLEIATFKELKLDGWKFDMTLDDLKELDAEFFAKPYNVGQNQYYGAYRKKIGLLVTLENDRLIKILHQPWVFNDDDADFTKGKKEFAAFVLKWSSQFGQPFSDQVSYDEKKRKESRYERKVIWVLDNIQFTIVQNGFNSTDAKLSVATITAEKKATSKL